MLDTRGWTHENQGLHKMRLRQQQDSGTPATSPALAQGNKAPTMRAYQLIMLSAHNKAGALWLCALA